jgi:hypothetical protein
MNLADRISARVRRTDSMLVNHDRRRWVQVMVFDLVFFLAAVISWALYPRLWGHDSWWALVAGCVVGFQLGRCAILTFRRSGAYRSGWLHGRQQMVFALAEAQRRGMTPIEWMEGELARDYAVLGVDPAEVAQLIAERERGDEI